MITELTKTQTDKFPEYVKNWTDKGLTTTPKTLEDATIDFSLFQKHILKREKIAPVILLDSPLKCWAAVVMVKADAYIASNPQLQEQIKSQVTDIAAQIHTKIWEQVLFLKNTPLPFCDLKNQVDDTVSESTKSRVKDEVQYRVIEQVQEVSAKIKSTTITQVVNQLFGPMSVGTMDVTNETERQVSDEVRGQVKEEVWTPINTKVKKQVLEQSHTSIHDQIKKLIVVQVADQVKAQINATLIREVTTELGKSARPHVHDQIEGGVIERVISRVMDNTSSPIHSQTRLVQGQNENQLVKQIYEQAYQEIIQQAFDQVPALIGKKLNQEIKTQTSKEIRSQVQQQTLEQISEIVHGKVRDNVDKLLLAQVLERADPQVRQQVSDQVTIPVLENIINQVEVQQATNIQDQIKKQIWDQACSSLFNTILADVQCLVDSKVTDELQMEVMDLIESVHGQTEEQVQEHVVNNATELTTLGEGIAQVRDKVQEQVRALLRGKISSSVLHLVNTIANTQADIFVRDQVQMMVEEKIEDPTIAQVRGAIGDQLEQDIACEITALIKEQVRESVIAVFYTINQEINDQVAPQISSVVWLMVRAIVTETNKLVNEHVRVQVLQQLVDLKFIYPYFDCQFWASWFAFYEFFKNECGFTYPKEYELFKNCQPYGMVFPIEELCIVCQPPTIIKKNNSGLHCEDGPALSYNGDNEIYALNGVVMQKEHVMTPAHKIDAAIVLKETNVEIRRELLRKIGIERMLESLPHTVLDKRGNYELLSIDLSEEIKLAKYLKMLNPSIGVWHLEGVDPGISNIDEALKWRNQNMFTDAEVLT